MAKQNILIADDDRDIAHLLSTYLRAQGFDVVLAFDAVQAIMTVHRTPPSAVILDINMPGGSGLNVLKEMQASARTNMIPVIVTSADTDPQLPATVTELGADAFFSKPFDFGKIQHTLCELLGKSRESRAQGVPDESWTQLKEDTAVSKERRKNVRINTRGWVLAEYRGQQFSLSNLSITGALVRVEEPPIVGTRVELRLVSRRLPEPIELTALVRRSTPGRGMGVQFTRFHGLAHSHVQELLLNLCMTRILVVNSDEDSRRALKLLFKEQHYSVLTAANGVEGLQKARESLPDLIILDLDLQRLSGPEVCQGVRGIPDLAHVPIILLVPAIDAADFRSMQELGATDFLARPFEAEELLNRVRALLAR